MDESERVAKIAVCPDCKGVIGWLSPVIGRYQPERETAEWFERGLDVQNFPANVPITINGHRHRCASKRS